MAFSTSAQNLTIKLNYLVWCLSESFQIPFVQNEQTEEYEIHQRSNVMNILHVDDSTEICKMYAEMLSLGNNTVKSVNDGLEGLELVLKNDYDLILLDICMPRYSGMDFIHDLKTKRPSEMKKVVILSVLELGESHQNELLKLGIHSVQEKSLIIQRTEILQKNMLLK